MSFRNLIMLFLDQLYTHGQNQTTQRPLKSQKLGSKMQQCKD